MNKLNQNDTTPWYKQFWPWLIIVLLTVSVTSSLYFVYLAVSNPDHVIDDNYYQHGLDLNKQDPSMLPAKPKTPGQ